MPTATNYPKRPGFFCCKFIRRMGKVCLGNDLGPDVCWLLAFIVSTEDAKGYRAAVSFYNEDLATRTGLSLAGMKRARQKAVEAGWLHHELGAKGRAARYYVTVPAWADEMDDAAGDEQPGELSGETELAQGEPQPSQQPTGKSDSGEMSAQGEPESHRQAADIRTECEPPSSYPYPLKTPPADAGMSTSSKPARKTPPKSKQQPEVDPRFATFWKAYPKRVAKQDAVKAFAKIDPDPDTLAAILAAIARQCASPDWQKEDGKFIPHPTTWLNGRRWEDEPVRANGPPAEPARIKRPEDIALLSETALNTNHAPWNPRNGHR